MKKPRWAVLEGIAVLTAIALLAMFWGFEPIAGVATGGICALLPKLVESEEKTASNGSS